MDGSSSVRRFLLRSFFSFFAWAGRQSVCHLRGNKLGVEGWTTIFNALSATALTTVSKITTWDLSGANLGPGIAEPLAKYLAVTASLTSLR